MFCEIFHTHTHTLRLVSPWRCPGNPAYPSDCHTAQRGYPIAQYTAYPSGGCSMAHRLQETDIQPREATLWPRDIRRPPYSQETAPTVPPAHPSFKNRHTHSTQHTQPSRRPQGPYRLQDYKTAQPANREHNKMPRRGKYREKPSRGNTEKSLTTRQSIDI